MKVVSFTRSFKEKKSNEFMLLENYLHKYNEKYYICFLHYVMLCYYVQSTETEESVCYLPSAHTCTNTLVLPRGPLLAKLPTEDEMFEIFDLAFSNSHFGKV